jgi:hypothetical protein
MLVRLHALLPSKPLGRLDHRVPTADAVLRHLTAPHHPIEHRAQVLVVLLTNSHEIVRKRS